MNIIKKLSKMIECELEDAEKYIDCALKYKIEYPNMSRTFYNLSLAEMEHQKLLHNEVVNIIEAYKVNTGEPPEAMQAIYDYVHEKQIEHAKEIKVLQAMYTE